MGHVVYGLGRLGEVTVGELRRELESLDPDLPVYFRPREGMATSERVYVHPPQDAFTSRYGHVLPTTDYGRPGADEGEVFPAVFLSASRPAQTLTEQQLWEAGIAGLEPYWSDDYPMSLAEVRELVAGVVASATTTTLVGGWDALAERWQRLTESMELLVRDHPELADAAAWAFGASA